MSEESQEGYSNQSEEEEVSDDGHDEEEYDLKLFGISRALPVPDFPPTWLGDDPPEAFDSAEEYLQWVRYEASRCPQTVTVEVNEEVLKAATGASTPAPSLTLSPLQMLLRGRDVPRGPDWCQPKKEWIRAFLVEFRALRAKIWSLMAERAGGGLVTLPHLNNKQEWERLCFGPSGDQGGPRELSIEGSAEVQEPKVSTLLSMDQVSVLSVLTFLIEGVEGSRVTSKRARWIYTLSAALEKPIHSDTAALFRSLFRKCSVMRANLTGGSSDPDLPLLNMLIVISGGYFGQDESVGLVLRGLGLGDSLS